MHNYVIAFNAVHWHQRDNSHWSRNKKGAFIMANKKVKAIKSEIKSRKKTIAKQEVKLKKAKKALKKAA